MAQAKRECPRCHGLRYTRPPDSCTMKNPCVCQDGTWEGWVEAMKKEGRW